MGCRGSAAAATGDACAFAVDGEEAEQIVVLVQSYAGDPAEIEELMGSIRQTVKETAGVDCRIELISRRLGLPLTSSGKLNRSQAKEAFLLGGDDPRSI